MTTHAFRLAILLATVTMASDASDYEITWSQISGGGAAVRPVGDYTITGTIGQFAPGPTGESMGYAVSGGFWPGAEDAAPCPADMNGDGELNFFDVSQFLTGYLAHDSMSDFNGDGLFNFFDVSEFLVAYQTGCP